MGYAASFLRWGSVAILGACGVHGADSVPPRGDPRWRHGGNQPLRVTVHHDDLPGEALLVLEVYSEDGRVRLGRVSMSNRRFPVSVELRGEDLALATDVVRVDVRVRLDADGDPDTRTDDDASARALAVFGGPSADLTLEGPEGRPPAAPPVQGYTSAVWEGRVAYDGWCDGRAVVAEVVDSNGSLLHRALYGPDLDFPIEIGFVVHDPPPGARLRAWLDEDGHPGTRSPGEPWGEIPYTGAAGYSLGLRELPGPAPRRPTCEVPLVVR